MTLFANIWKYLRFITRRERVISVIWVAAISGFAILLTAIYPELFSTQESLVDMAAALGTPAMLAMIGPVYGLDALTPAIAMAQECLLWLAMTTIVMNIFLVNRHTRVDEELGRLEMLTSLPVGRLAGSLAVVKAAFVLDAAISLLTAFGIIAVDIEGLTVAGAFVYAFSVGVQGLLFAAITLLMAQLFSTARGSMGWSFAILGLSYMLRAYGDMTGNALSYISPLGLGLRVEAFYSDNFMPVIALLAETIAVTAVALSINKRRDVGAGVFPAKKGRAQASGFLKSPLGLAWRLSQGGFVAWAATMFALGASYGSVVGQIDSFVEDNATIMKMITAHGGDSGMLVDAFLPLLFGIMALVSTIPVINTMNRLRSEEKRGRIEQIYACSVPRAAMFMSFLCIAVAEAVILSLLTALGLYAAAQSTGMVSLGMLIKAALSFVPAMLVLAGLAALLIGLLPRLNVAVWVLFGYSFLMLYFGRLFDVPKWATNLSPYYYVPQIPIEDFKAAPIVALLLISAVLAVAGIIAYRQRDITA